MKRTYALPRKQRTHNLRYIVRTLLMKLAPGPFEQTLVPAVLEVPIKKLSSNGPVVLEMFE